MTGVLCTVYGAQVYLKKRMCYYHDYLIQIVRNKRILGTWKMIIFNDDTSLQENTSQVLTAFINFSPT